MTRTRAEIADHEWRATRHHAQTVECPYCHAEPGHTCTRLRDDQPLLNAPAHSARITAAQENHP